MERGGGAEKALIVYKSECFIQEVVFFFVPFSPACSWLTHAHEKRFPSRFAHMLEYSVPKANGPKAI